jgi:hypothetical protein
LKDAKWKHLLEEYPDFKRFYNNLARNSEITADERMRILYRFLIRFNFTPTTLVETAQKDRKKIEDILMDFTTQLNNEGKAPGYIRNYIKAVRTWLGYNGIELKQRINTGNQNEHPTIEDEVIPTKEELKQVLNYADDRGRTSIALMSQSGLRPESLGDAKGMDGLKISDLPELIIEKDTVSFAKIPMVVVVKASLNKARHKYFTFLSEEGCSYLKDYLEKRLANGEKLNGTSAVIAYKLGYSETGFGAEGKRSVNHVTTKTLTKEIRDAMRPKFNWRPYILRAYFDTQLMVAENHGKLSHAYRQFFMAHKGDIEAQYTTNKGRLPESVVEDMRESYRKCQEYLQTTIKETTSEERIKERFRRQLLLVAGFDSKEVAQLDLSMDDSAFQQMVKKRLLEAMANQGASQKVVRVNEVEFYISEGWDFVASLPGKKAVIKLPDNSNFKKLNN